MSRKLKVTGKIGINIKGQEALNRWQREALKNYLDGGRGAAQELRFTCRIAQDVNEAFEKVGLDDGSTLTLNPKGKAQFGRNAKGNPYLTVGVIWDGDGAPYRVHWEGAAVPLKMQRTAVRHDEGKKVARTQVSVDLSKATITPVRHDLQHDGTKAPRKPAKTGPKLTRRSRNHDRLCRADLEAKG